MADIALSDIGIQLRKKDGTGKYPVFIPITDAPAMSSEPDSIEVTELQNPTKSYILGRGGVDKLPFGFNYTSTTMTAIEAVADGSTSADYLLELPDGSGYTFSGASSVSVDAIAAGSAIKGKFTVAPTVPPVRVASIASLLPA